MEWFTSPRILIPRVLIFAGLVLCGSVLRADDIIYSNFGPDLTYNDCCGVVVVSEFDFSVAEKLPALNADYNLTAIQFVASSRSPDPSNSVTLSIYGDVGGVPGGSPIEALTLSGQLPPFDGSLAPVLTVNSLTNPLLHAGSIYWIVMDGPTTESLFWDTNSTSTSGYVRTDGTAGNWINSFPTETNGVFEVDGLLVVGSETAPEPAAWWLMAGGLAAIAFAKTRRQRRFGSQYCR